MWPDLSGFQEVLDIRVLYGIYSFGRAVNSFFNFKKITWKYIYMLKAASDALLGNLCSRCWNVITESKAEMNLGANSNFLPLPTWRSQRGRVMQQLRKPRLFVAAPWETVVLYLISPLTHMSWCFCSCPAQQPGDSRSAWGKGWLHQSSWASQSLLGWVTKEKYKVRCCQR